jgi:hypothetical protein
MVMLACGGGDGTTEAERTDSGAQRVVMPSTAPVRRPQPPAPAVEPAPQPLAAPERLDHVPEMMSDLPMPKDLALQYGEVDDEGVGTARYEGQGDPNSVIDGLIRDMEAKGWTVRMKEHADNAAMIFITKGNQVAQATAAEVESGKVRVELNFMQQEALAGTQPAPSQPPPE